MSFEGTFAKLGPGPTRARWAEVTEMATAVEAIPSSYDLDTTNVIGLLKAIAAGEAEGGRRLAQWAAMTSDPKLA